MSAETPLKGIRVLDAAGAVSSGFLAAWLWGLGAEITLVEEPTGASVRNSPAFEQFYGGASSVVIASDNDASLAELQQLVANADIVISSPGAANLAAQVLTALKADGTVPACEVQLSNFGSIEGWEDQLDDVAVLARIGGLEVFGAMADRDGPAYVSVPFCSYSAAQLALQGILADQLLHPRGQRNANSVIETSLLEGILAHDIWNVNLRTVTSRYPDAFMPAPHVEDGIPNSALVYRLLVARAKCGEWLQFSQTSPHLYRAFMKSLGMEWMFDDPEWQAIPLLEEKEQRLDLWNRMISGVADRTLEDWRTEFDHEPNVWAERFRAGPEVLDHPQLIDDNAWTEFGSSARLHSPIRFTGVTPREPQPAPAIGERVVADDRTSDANLSTGQSEAPVVQTSETASPASPLAGITVVDLGLFFSGPMSSALLADLGARVIKVEPIAGDPLRELGSFPEIAAIKATQGKESIALDLRSDRGREIIHQIIRNADVVVQSFRGGTAERLGVDDATLHEINPQLVYLSASGYGTTGTCASRPAFAPTIAAASGIAWQLAGSTIHTGDAPVDVDDTRANSVRLLSAANTSFAQCDGVGALTNASAILAGLIERNRTGRGVSLEASMLHASVWLNCEAVVGNAALIDDDLTGPHPMKRLYETETGWVLLHDALELLDKVVAKYGVDTPDGLVEAFRSRTADDVVVELKQLKVSSSKVVHDAVENVVLDDLGPTSDLLVEVDHPMLGMHPRLRPLVTINGARTQVRPGCMAGQHTYQILEELRIDADDIATLYSNQTIA